MKSLLRFLCTPLFKQRQPEVVAGKQNQPVAQPGPGALRVAVRSQALQGFTLIELLVAMVISSIVLTTMLGFMNTLLQNDKQEQAKSATEQDIQDALNFIAEDMREAVYIYDGAALTTNSNTDPLLSGIQDQLPPKVGNSTGCPSSTDNGTQQTCTPVLAFWKRETVPRAIPAVSSGVTFSSNCSTGASSTTNCAKTNDAYVYALVVYYLVTTPDTNWKGAARISRFMIRDGVKNPNGAKVDPAVDTTPTVSPRNYNYIKSYNGGSGLAAYTNTAADNAVCYSGTTLTGTDNNCPSPGFQLFDLNITSPLLSSRMNSWQRFPTTNSTTLYNASSSTVVLVDYIDPNWLNPNGGASLPCSDIPNGVQSPVISAASSLVPGFYACVDKNNRIAKVTIRGNALTRTSSWNKANPIYSNTSTTLDSKITYTPNREIYFPTATLPFVQAKGFLLN